MFYLPEEIEVWYIIPALRSKIASCLVNNNKLTYEKTGKILGISKAAISQYIKGKRAGKIKLPESLCKEFKKSCDSLVKEKTNSMQEIQRLLKHIRDKQIPCEVCGILKEGQLKDCDTIKFDGENYR